MTSQDTLSAFNGLNALEVAVQELPHLTLRFYSYGIMLHRRLENGGETEYAVSPDRPCRMQRRRAPAPRPFRWLRPGVERSG